MMRFLYYTALALALALAAVGMAGEWVWLKVSALGRGLPQADRVFGEKKGGVDRID